MILRHLMEADRHVAEGEKIILRQREIIEEAELEGKDTAEFRKLLGTFESTQALHVADQTRIRKELAEAAE